MENIDEILKNSLNKVEFPKEFHVTVDMLEKSRKESTNKYVYRNVLKFAACLVVLAIISTIYIVTSNNDEIELKAEENNTNTNLESPAKDNKYIIYSKNPPNSIGSRIFPSYRQLYEMSQIVAIVKVNEVKGINYDIEYGAHSQTGEYMSSFQYIYTFPRQLGKLTIVTTLKGNVKEGDILEFRKKGAVISYKEYLKHYEYYPSMSRDLEMEKEIEEAIRSGINIDELYLDISEGAKNVNIESGKYYLVYLYEKANGYWAQTDENGMREYNMENNTILNNKTKIWEEFNIIYSDEDNFPEEYYLKEISDNFNEK